MHIEFLGTAGYHPSEERHTSCTYLPDATPESGFVLDCGTGAFRLVGRELPSRLHVFLSHAHLDHTVGLTFLLDVLHGKTCEALVYGSAKTIDVITKTVFDSPLFPVDFRHHAFIVEPGEILRIEGVEIRPFALTHPGDSLGYRFDWKAGNVPLSSTRLAEISTENTRNRSLGYVTDTVGDGLYLEEIRDLDVLIHERNFADDLQEFALATGHCSSRDVAAVAREVQPKRLILTHFNPLTKSEEIDADGLRNEFPDVVFARDSMTIEF